MEAVFLEGIRIAILFLIPLIGAALGGGIVGGIIQSFTRIEEPVISYAFKVGAIVGCLYLILPGLVPALSGFLLDSLRGAW